MSRDSDSSTPASEVNRRHYRLVPFDYLHGTGVRATVVCTEARHAECLWDECECPCHLQAARDEVAGLRASLKSARAARDTWHERHNDVVEQRDALRAERKEDRAYVMRLRAEVERTTAERDEWKNLAERASSWVPAEAMGWHGTYRAASEQEVTDA